MNLVNHFMQPGFGSAVLFNWLTLLFKWLSLFLISFNWSVTTMCTLQVETLFFKSPLGDIIQQHCTHVLQVLLTCVWSRWLFLSAFWFMLNIINETLFTRRAEAPCVFQRVSQVFPCMFTFVCVHVSAWIHECAWVMCRPPSIIPDGLPQSGGVSNVEGNVVLQLLVHWVVFVPWNKHMWQDEQLLASCPRPYGKSRLVVQRCVTINHRVFSHQDPANKCTYVHPQLPI